jgi:ubiquinone/menaquinone biosynthesis C-methylase UbiE
MGFKGDTEKQAILRDRMIKRSKKRKRSNYVLKIIPALKPGMRLLDIGCGTAHIIRELAMDFRNAVLVGLDVSPAMLKIALQNTIELSNVALVEGDGLRLPFPSSVFDVAITRLAEYSTIEVYRILKKGGMFFEYGLGPEANKEIVEFFPDRIDRESFFFPRNLEEWKEETCGSIRDAGFSIVNIEDFKEDEYHRSEDSLMDLIEMVPLVVNFERKKDRRIVEELATKYETRKGIKITWHYYVLEARKPR